MLDSTNAGRVIAAIADARATANQADFWATNARAARAAGNAAQRAARAATAARNAQPDNTTAAFAYYEIIRRRYNAAARRYYRAARAIDTGAPGAANWRRNRKRRNYAAARNAGKGY